MRKEDIDVEEFISDAEMKFEGLQPKRFRVRMSLDNSGLKVVRIPKSDSSELRPAIEAAMSSRQVTECDDIWQIVVELFIEGRNKPESHSKSYGVSEDRPSFTIPKDTSDPLSAFGRDGLKSLFNVLGSELKGLRAQNTALMQLLVNVTDTRVEDVMEFAQKFSDVQTEGYNFIIKMAGEHKVLQFENELLLTRS